MKSTPTTACRLSGESLDDADLLIDLPSCPFPGIYPDRASDALAITGPLRVVQSRQSGFVQLADHFDPSMYCEYAFAGGGAGAYRNHLAWFASQVAESFSLDSTVLEVGTGDGFLVELLHETGFREVCGIDPSRAAKASVSPRVKHGFFPQDLPNPNQKFDLIICRHVLEHIDDLRPFVGALATSLSETGQLWLEVPDLDTTIERELWSNFYQLHCNYFSENTLDQLCGGVGLRCIQGEVVEIFGGSILRRYVCGVASQLPPPPRVNSIKSRIDLYRQHLTEFSNRLPEGSVGYGAAERTAAILGFGPAIASRLSRLFDGNPLLADRYLAGTNLRIASKKQLFLNPPPAVVLFALSNIKEIIAEWKTHLPSQTLVAIPSGDFPVLPLRDFP